jgi:hypothetical protein
MILEQVTVIGGSLCPRIAGNPGNSKSVEKITQPDFLCYRIS